MLIVALKKVEKLLKNIFASLGTVAVYTTVSFLQVKENNYISTYKTSISPLLQTIPVNKIGVFICLYSS